MFVSHRLERAPDHIISKIKGFLHLGNADAQSLSEAKMIRFPLHFLTKFNKPRRHPIHSFFTTSALSRGMKCNISLSIKYRLNRGVDLDGILDSDHGFSLR